MQADPRSRMTPGLGLRRFPAWQVVLGYSFATFVVIVLFSGVHPVELIINSALFFLLIGFVFGRGRYEFWVIIGSLLISGALGLFIGHHLLGLSLWLRYGLEIPIATGLTYLLADRRRTSRIAGRSLPSCPPRRPS
jgi:hypothetical protein